MSKKLLCLFLSLVMFLGVCLTACGEKDDDDAMKDIEDDASQSAVTLSMYLMSEAPVNKCKYDEGLVGADGKNDSQMCEICIKETGKEIKESNVVDTCTYQAISKAVNKITESKFKTRLELRYYTEEEYYKALDAAFAARDKAKAEGKLNETVQEGGDLTYDTDEDGVVSIRYPSITGYQVDIFYMGGKDNYDKYKESGRLQRLDDEINSASKDIATSIPQQYLGNIKSLNKGTFALPTSKTIGEYTYLLLNKDAMTKVYLRSDTGSTTYEEYTSLTSEKVQEFLNLVIDDPELAEDYYPIKTNLSSIELMINNLKYWGVDEEGKLSDAFSVLGGYYGMNDDYLDANKYAKLENLFENEQFVNDIKVLKGYEFDGYYTEEEGKSFAVGYMTGGKDIVEEYGDEYEIIPVAYPRLTEAELYSDMFAVCANTTSVARSMQILTFLNTDTAFRNLILYGIEGMHYELITATYPNPDPDDPVKEFPYVDKYGEPVVYVKRIEVSEKLTYAMSADKTGNTMIAYTECADEDDVRDLLYLKKDADTITKTGYGILQNQEAKVALDLGFKLDSVDKKSLDEIRKLSAEVLNSIKSAGNEVELELAIAKAKADIAASEDVKANLDCQSEETHNKSTCKSLYCCYQAWLKSKEIIK